jgi:intein/homing endonuclease
LIKTEDGHNEIKDIKVGDYVWSQDTDTGETGLKKVLNVFIKESDVLEHIFVNGEEIKTTPTHPFWVVGKGWTSAKDLKKGDKLLLSSGEEADVEKHETERLGKPIKVYNFEVEDWHTY